MSERTSLLLLAIALSILGGVLGAYELNWHERCARLAFLFSGLCFGYYYAMFWRKEP